MNSIPKISIIIPVYNALKYLSTCIASVKAQTMQDFEVFLVDDASTDGSGEECERLAGGDPRFHVIHAEKNSGCGLSNNVGLERASGEYLSFLDADDFIDKDALQVRYELAKKYDLDIVKGDSCRFTDEDTLYPLNHKHRHETNTDKNQIITDLHTLKDLSLRMFFVAPGSKSLDFPFKQVKVSCLYRRSMVEEHKLRFRSERELMCEDTLWVFQAFQNASSFGVVDHMVYYYRHSPNSISTRPRTDAIERIAANGEQLLPLVSEYVHPELAKSTVCGFGLNLIRGCLKPIFLSKAITKAEKKEWLKESKNHQYVKKLMTEYDWHRLPRMQRILLRAFFSGNYKLLSSLIRMREMIRVIKP